MTTARAGRWTKNRAIAGVEDGTRDFYVHVKNATVDVVVARSAFGNKYLKTAADGIQPDNLLSLPECPSVKGIRMAELPDGSGRLDLSAFTSPDVCLRLAAQGLPDAYTDLAEAYLKPNTPLTIAHIAFTAMLSRARGLHHGIVLK